jgi:hypothetical protein
MAEYRKLAANNLIITATTVLAHSAHPKAATAEPENERQQS